MGTATSFHSDTGIGKQSSLGSRAQVITAGAAENQRRKARENQKAMVWQTRSFCHTRRCRLAIRAVRNRGATRRGRVSYNSIHRWSSRTSGGPPQKRGYVPLPASECARVSPSRPRNSTQRLHLTGHSRQKLEFCHRRAILLLIPSPRLVRCSSGGSMGCKVA